MKIYADSFGGLLLLVLFGLEAALRNQRGQLYYYYFIFYFINTIIIKKFAFFVT